MNEIQIQQAKREMHQQVYIFLGLIFFTILAFSLVTLDFQPTFVVPILFLFACIQVTFQLTYFMHMKEKGHAVMWVFLTTAFAITLVTIIAFLKLIWW